MSSSTITPSGASTAVASSRSRVSAARECSPSMWTKRGRRPSSFASSSAGAMRRLSAFQVMRRSGRDAVPGAIGLEAVDDLRVGPVEQIDAERLLSRRQRVREGDEEAPLEGADLGDWTGDPHLRLHAQQPAADGGGKARRHAGHGRHTRSPGSDRRWRCRSGWMRWLQVRRQERTCVLCPLEESGATIAEASGFRKAELFPASSGKREEIGATRRNGGEVGGLRHCSVTGP